jgi:hypothetical protein
MKLHFLRILVLTALSLVFFSYGQEVKKKKKKIASIDLSHWKITVPEENLKNPGNPIEIGFPEILDYANNPILKKWMYNDEKDQSIVFYAFPSGTTTANSHFSRSELRETMVPGNNNINWTFAQGGKFKAVYAMDAVSREKDGKYSKVIIAQIHGRLTNAQRDLIGQKDNNAPPILKIYWINGKIRVKTKVLKDLNVSEKDILRVDAWTDDEGINFKKNVDFNKFTLEIIISDSKMEVILNGNETLVYNDINIKKWGVFENYFKAGNYFQSKDTKVFAKVKIYALKVTH